MWPGPDVDHPSTSRTEVRDKWSYTSTPPVCVLAIDRDNFTSVHLSVRLHLTFCELRLCHSNGNLTPITFHLNVISLFYYILLLLLLLLQALNPFNWKFWPSQRHPPTLLYPGHRLTNFWSSFDQGPVWCCPPIYIWVFLLVSWLRDSI